MKFSIIITTYNRLSLLKRAIDCALAQSIPCEAIVADDCSTDDTQAYMEQLGDRVIYHRNPHNMGHSATMNAGVARATGEWIKPLDDDDYLDPHCIERFQEAIALRPQAAIGSCQAAQVTETGVELSRSRIAGPGRVFYIPQEDIHYGMLLEQVPFGTPVQVIFRRDAFLQSGGWDSTLDGNCDDIDSWIKIAQFGDAIFLNECLAYRTIWSGAYNRKFPLTKRMNTNMLMKERIYPLVNSTHRAQLPEIQDMQNYLRLHWSLVALKQHKPVAFLKTAFPAVFSYRAWDLLRRSLVFRLLQKALAQQELEERTWKIQQQRRSRTLETIGFTVRDLEELRLKLRKRSVKAAWKEKRFADMLGLLCMFLSSLLTRHLWYAVLPDCRDRPTPILHQLKANLLLSEKIYQFVNEKYRSSIPDLSDYRVYLKLRWTLAALRQGRWLSAIATGFPAYISPTAWRLLVEELLARKRDKHPNKIRKYVLLDR